MSTTTTEADTLVNSIMDSLLAHLQESGHFPNAARNTNGGSGALLLDHEPEEPLLDRTYGIESWLGGDNRTTVALLYVSGGQVSVLDQSDPVDAQGLPRALASAMSEAARRQLAQRRQDQQEDDRYYENYEAAVHLHEAHLDGP